MDERFGRGECTFEIVVGWTSALGREKSQYLLNVFGGGREM